VSEPHDAAPAHVHELAAARAAARTARNFGVADELRDQIGQLGWVVTDAPDGYSLAPVPEAAARAGYPVLTDPSAVPVAGQAGRATTERLATVALLVEGWPDDLQACVSSVLAHAPGAVMISALDVGNRDGAGDALHELAVANPGRIEAWHVASSPGWSAGRNALLRADPGPVHVIMETSTILTGDAISPLLRALSVADVVAAGWRGTDPDQDLRGFHDAGPGQVSALLGYLLAVRTEAGIAVGGLPAKARFYRNADLEFCLRLGQTGRLMVPDGQLPVRQSRHRGYHDSDPDYRDRESLRNYRRVLELLRARAV
jgi:hypothetical protein